jgi:hypothetical protein
MPTGAQTPAQRSDRYLRTSKCPTPATQLSRWVHPNGITRSHPSPSSNVLNQYIYVE